MPNIIQKYSNAQRNVSSSDTVLILNPTRSTIVNIIKSLNLFTSLSLSQKMTSIALSTPGSPKVLMRNPLIQSQKHVTFSPSTNTFMPSKPPLPLPPPSASETPIPSTVNHWSSRLPTLSTKMAKASGNGKLSTVQCATQESLASGLCLKTECGQCSHTVSQNGNMHTSIPAPSNLLPTTPNNHNKEESAFQAWDEMSDLQASYVVSQILGDGFEWGISSSDSSVTASEKGRNGKWEDS